MTFYWICPGCDHENFYSGSNTTNVVVQCKSCKAKVKASSHKREEKPIAKNKTNYQNQPETTDKLPKKYSTSIINRPSKIQIAIDDVDWITVLKIMDRGISTIRNKSEVKRKKGAYYFDYLKWLKEIKKIEEIASVMKLLEGK